jgi:hypothetical protein
MKWVYQNSLGVLALEHLLKDWNLIFISFLKSLRWGLVNIILVSSENIFVFTVTGVETIFEKLIYEVPLYHASTL